MILEGFPGLKESFHSRTQAEGKVSIFHTVLMEESKNARGHTEGSSTFKVSAHEWKICVSTFYGFISVLWSACQWGGLGNTQSLMAETVE